MKFDKKFNYLLRWPYILAATLVMVLFSRPAFGQPKKKDFLLGGSLSVYSDNGRTPQNQEISNTSFTGFNFEPTISFFVSKRIAVGFSSLIDYEGSVYTYKLKNDTTNKTVQFKNNSYTLSYSFGINGSYFLPLGNNFYFKNTIDWQWGNIVRGDKIATFFSVDKPQQDRINFMNLRYLASLTYFMKPQLSVSFGINPISYSFEMNKRVRSNQADVFDRSHKFGLETNATGFFIALNYLIIADDSN